MSTIKIKLPEDIAILCPKNCFGNAYLTHEVDLSSIIESDWVDYQVIDKDKLEFKIIDSLLYLRKSVDNVIIREDIVEFTGYIPMSFSIKCKTYCSDCGICSW